MQQVPWWASRSRPPRPSGPKTSAACAAWRTGSATASRQESACAGEQQLSFGDRLLPSPWPRCGRWTAQLPEQLPGAKSSWCCPPRPAATEVALRGCRLACGTSASSCSVSWRASDRTDPDLTDDGQAGELIGSMALRERGLEPGNDPCSTRRRRPDPPQSVLSQGGADAAVVHAPHRRGRSQPRIRRSSGGSQAQVGRLRFRRRPQGRRVPRPTRASRRQSTRTG